MDRHSRRGVTLIEMLVAMSVLGLVLIPILGILNFSTHQFGSQTGRAKTILLANQAMNAMCSEIGQATSTGTDTYGRLYFVMPNTGSAQTGFIPTLLNGVLSYSSGNYVQFYLSNQNGQASSGQFLWRQTLAPDMKGTPDTVWSLLRGGASAPPRFPSVTALSFTTTGMPANTVRVSLTMADKEGGQTSSYTVSRSVYLSNHN